MTGAFGIGWVIGWWLAEKLPPRERVRVLEVLLLCICLVLPALPVYFVAGGVPAYLVGLALGGGTNGAWLAYVRQRYGP